ncbi:MAG: winged helix-turn-helix transcriptional regulator [Pseudomonadales bacterium]|nr:winged helix-turn-helix transcriptional regulator [Pseudomonadales bacterium]
MKKPSPRQSLVADSTPGRPVTARIMAGLTQAMDWFDNSLQNVVASQGYQPFHRTQSMIIMHVALGIDNPADIAREMGLTRQNVHHMAKGLIEGGIMETTPDARDPRRSLYRLADAASELRNLALTTMTDLERVLEQRIGAARVKAMRAALDADWGPDISSAAELQEILGNGTKQSKGSAHEQGPAAT